MEIKTMHITGICEVKAKHIISTINTRSMNESNDTLEVFVDGHEIILEYDEDPCGNVCAVTIDNKVICGRQEGQFWTHWPAVLIGGMLTVRHEYSGFMISIDEECMIWIDTYDTSVPYIPCQPEMNPPWK